jgi:hypothetical protein
MKYRGYKVITGVAIIVFPLIILALGMRLAFREHPLIGKRILPNLDINEVASIDYDGKKLVSLQNGNWRIDAYDGYPADKNKVEGFLSALTNMVVWIVEKDTNICQRVMYNPVSIVLRDFDGKALASLDFGQKHGVIHSGFVESVFVPDGRYMSFMGETVAVREQFRLFWGHRAEINGLCANWINAIPTWQIPPLRTDNTPIVITADMTGEGDPANITMLLSWENNGNAWKMGRTFEIEGLRSGESVNTECTSSVMDALGSIGFYDVKRSSHFPDAERAAAKVRRIFTINVFDGTQHATQTMTLYDCGDKCYVEMQGWVYTIHRDVAQKLLVTRNELIVTTNGQE